MLESTKKNKLKGWGHFQSVIPVAATENSQKSDLSCSAQI